VSPLNKQIPCFLFKSLIKLLPYEKMTKEPIMNPLDLFNQVKEMIEKKDFDAAKKFVEDFISLHQTLKPIFEKVYAEYLPILEKSYTEFEATIYEHPTILAEAFTGTKEIEEIDWTSNEISVIPTLLLSDFYFQDSELLILGAKSLEVIQHVIQTRLDKQQERINVFKNLGDKTRYQIFCEIAKGTKSVKKIAEQLGITSATVSYHINELVLSNLVVHGWNKKDCTKAIHTELITEVMNGLMEDSFMTNTLENEK